MKRNTENNYEFSFYDDPLIIYNTMLADIRNAQTSVYLETYKFSNDPIGIKFRDMLTRKARQGVEVCLLIDSWGSGVSESFFWEMIQYGGKLKFFKKLKIRLDIFSANHMRNHRKLLIIDDKISYIGSANITGYSLNWRESVLRISGKNLAKKFKNIFFEDYELSKKYFPNKVKYTRPVKVDDLEIIKDVPGSLVQATRNKLLKLIKGAKSEIVIETPYFLPGSFIRKALMNAAENGVNVLVITPLHSDVGLFDILRNKYLGILHKRHIKIMQYYPHNLHAKLMLIDKETFCLGSGNFDYRSFRFQHEINLVGKNEKIVHYIIKHFEEIIQDCEAFNFEKWQKRSKTLRLIEYMLVPIRHLF